MNPKLHALIPLLALTGCLARDISRTIDGLECHGSTGACPTGSSSETTNSDPSGVMATTPGSSDTGVIGETDGQTGGTSTGTTSGEITVDASATGTSSTGEPVPECGNGVVEAFGPEPEDCDDGNDVPSDGCNHCGRDRLVFVTSKEYSGGSFVGVGGADQRCRSLADQVGLPNFAGFKAWLSDSQTDARDRMFRGRGRYVLINGLVVADSWDALLAGALDNPINVTQLGESRDDFVWTGTNPDGTAVAGADHCSDWTGDLFANEGYRGSTQEVSAEWTLAVSMIDQPQLCAGPLALYCFEQ